MHINELLKGTIDRTMKKILLAEQDEVTRKLMDIVFSDYPWEFIYAGSPSEVIDMVSADKPDVVIASSSDAPADTELYNSLRALPFSEPVSFLLLHTREQHPPVFENDNYFMTLLKPFSTFSIGAGIKFLLQPDLINKTVTTEEAQSFAADAETGFSSETGVEDEKNGPEAAESAAVNEEPSFGSAEKGFEESKDAQQVASGETSSLVNAGLPDAGREKLFDESILGESSFTEDSAPSTNNLMSKLESGSLPQDYSTGDLLNSISGDQSFAAGQLDPSSLPDSIKKQLD